MTSEPARKLTIQLHVRKNSNVNYNELAYVLLVFAKNLTAKRGTVSTVTPVDETKPPWWFTQYRPDQPGSDRG
ncbi:hypothetical protein DMC64_34535 [Amycolatopsis sp. WAC 04197]|uniref:hypothetical protein n=1 Tax=Amycolatopsis sp. WAC 04197 TaxID=2203199 RepID=UPI000F76D299|nr:hypothetical protein [Amycolatopsis sp. WAC 04197]RSN40054.1 hypothetical protein DMC64_34535 [Amycolatopsis sp. WAC 04197]